MAFVPDLVALRSIVAVADCGGFHRAAEAFADHGHPATVVGEAAATNASATWALSVNANEEIGTARAPAARVPIP